MRIAAVAAASVVLAACSPSPDGKVRLPPTTGSFDYQLGGEHDVAGLAVVVRDASAAPMPGAYNVCYVNGFQTQPGDGDDWLARHGTAVLRDADGLPVTDPDWPNEYVLDPTTAAQRATILDAVGPLLIDCAQKGFDAVELDNLDTFTRFPQISEEGARELARSYVSLAHDNELAVGQKNAAEYASQGRELGFDFAVAEECTAYRECGRYRDAYGSRVLQIEYPDDLTESFAHVCASPDRAPLTILRDRELVPADAKGHVHEQC